MDRVNTISEPAKMPESTLGMTTPTNRLGKPAPRLAAPSSSSSMLMAVMTAMTERIMNGRVKMTCPTRMISQLPRKAVHQP